MTRPENPAKMPHFDPELAAVLRDACSRAGLDDVGAHLIHHYANVVALVPAERAVARIDLGGRLHRARRALHVTRWLTGTYAFPATTPLAGLEPIVLESAVVTFWSYYPQPLRAASPDSAQLGRLIRDLHRLPAPPVKLPRWRPLRSLLELTASPVGEAALPPADHQWLLARIDEVRQELDALKWPLGWGTIHGDAWAGNLLWDTATPAAPVRLGDWDSVCHGPREVDLIPSWHAAVRYGRGPQWAHAFARAYGHDLRSWAGFPALFVMRDLVQLAGPMRRAAHDVAFTAALRERLDGIRANDRGTWREF